METAALSKHSNETNVGTMSKSRGELSLEPYTLSDEEAAVLEEILEKGSARCKVETAILPEFNEANC